MTDSLLTVVTAALNGMHAKPSALSRSLDFYSSDHGTKVDVSTVIARLASGEPNDPARQVTAAALQHWDFLREPGWADGTSANTHERRERIYSLLQLDNTATAVLDQIAPVWIAADPPIVIAEEHSPWYNADEPGFQFYLPRYREHLLKNNWSATSVETLAQVTASVVERISNPNRQEQYQSKGLVVGYVQSGKTANFIGVIARAADAGYRLFIVLGGTMDILRTQTQRRIDKELIGKELLEQDYLDDDEWASFLSHGALPSQLEAFDWQRLTGPKDDYQRLRFGIDALEFPKYDPSKPLFDPINLQKSRARIMVIKKNPTRIRSVARDLARIKARLADIPALVIDDESDLASVNTTKPTTAQVRARTETNLAIVELLKQLPRSQYIGYTATPFANVFIDPSDAEDLFPKDFIVSLPRPEGYMGIQDFHDLEVKPDGFHSNERAFVRSVRGNDTDSENLPRAIDSYVVSGAIKLFRASADPSSPKFKHHTMLVHVSHHTSDQYAMARVIDDLLDSGSYHSAVGWERLKRLWEEDFRPVSQVRSGGWQDPPNFEELREYIGECLQRLEHGKRVLVVNGTPAADTPDFDRQPIWKIICGGAKLSRGYTIEGLTISYYRRRTNATDTLMQMGRWFGFREGYKDLVRLFVGRAEPVHHGQPFDLYSAFEAACRDELHFRAELRRYSNLPGGERITPKQVPPLVPAHLLRPTSSNKMYNAVIKSVNMGGEYRESTIAPTEQIAMQHNENLTVQLISPGLAAGNLTVEPSSAFEAYWVVLEPGPVLAWLNAYKWSGASRPMEHDIEFLSGSHGGPEIDDWLFLAPQIASARVWSAAGVPLASPFRTRVGSRFGVYSESRHRLVASYITRVGTDVPTANSATRALRKARRGVILFYPVHESDNSGFTMGFALQYPDNSIPRAVVWGVRDPSQPNAIVVNRP